MDIRKLLNQIAVQELQLQETEFLAPCVRGGLVRTRVANIIYSLAPQPRNFEGWGIFLHTKSCLAVLERAREWVWRGGSPHLFLFCGGIEGVFLLGFLIMRF